jgi:pimeloyl-ACP methyl ester carboxylesterase
MVFYRTVMVDGLSIFYREAGRPDAPTLLLLHGFPSSSRMYEPLLARLSAYYHLVAPDYPGFGHSDAPGAKTFSYTFDHIAQVMEHFTEALGLDRYALYMQDYGGPVGFRLAIARPDACRRSSYRTPSPTTKDSARSGRSGESSGPTGPQTRPVYARISRPLLPPSSVMSVPIQIPRHSIPIDGRTSSRS